MGGAAMATERYALSRLRVAGAAASIRQQSGGQRAGGREQGAPRAGGVGAFSHR